MKNKMFLDYVQLLMIGWVIWAKTLSEMQKTEKGPLSHQKIKCSFLDYIQLLMIGWAISTENIDRNAKKWKKPPKSSKNKMFIFGLCSTSDDWLSNPSKKTMTKTQKNEKGPLSHWKIKCLFFNYINFWWLAEQSKQKTLTKTEKNEKGPPKSSKNKMFVFGLCSTSDDWPSDLNKKRWPKRKKN